MNINEITLEQAYKLHKFGLAVYVKNKQVFYEQDARC